METQGNAKCGKAGVQQLCQKPGITNEDGGVMFRIENKKSDLETWAEDTRGIFGLSCKKHLVFTLEAA